MTWRPGPPNTALLSDGYKEIGTGYKVTVTDGDTGAGRSPGSQVVSNQYKCVDLYATTTHVLYRAGATPTLTDFDGIIFPETGIPVKLRLPTGATLQFITVATGSSAASTVYINAFKEES